MPTRQRIKLLQMRSWVDGLNTRDDPSEIELTELADAQNIEIDDKSLYQRPGYIEHRSDASTDEVAGLYEHVENDGTRYLLKVVGTSLYYDDGNGWSSVALPGGYSITDGERWSWVTYGGVTYGCNGTDNVLAISGATPTATEKSTMPLFTIAVVYKNRVYIRDETSKQQIKWSNLADAETWDSSDVAAVDPRKAADYQIKAMSVLHGQIVIFKIQSIHMFGGPNTKITPAILGVGCLNNNVVAFDGNSSLIFADYDAIYATNLTSLVRLSDKVEPTWLTRNANYDDNVVAIFHKNKYRIAYTHADDTTNSRELVYDTRYGWTRTKGINVNFYDKALLNSRIELIFGDSNNAKIYKFGTDASVTTSDDGTAIESYGVSSLIDFGLPEARRKIKKGYVHVEDSGNYSLKMGYRFDQNSSWTEENISLQNPSAWNWDDTGHYYDGGDDWPSGGGSIDEYFFIAAGKRRRIQMRAYMSGDSNYWRLYHIGIPFRQDRRFK